ncbi:MAG: PilZ domain-containing protein [Candidatus Omnitrophica bacterium]|nr:PilZ domain-containing protein [Candidatus Omnitrophota bacterium]
MSGSRKGERRRHERYETDLKIAFSVNFNLETKIKFQVQGKPEDTNSNRVYSGVGHNINVEGLGFSSGVKLEKGEMLLLDVFLPTVKEPIPMSGKVRWCRSSALGEFKTGVKILKVRDEDVQSSVFLDPTNKVQWSILLESVFGGFKESILKKKSLE